MSLLTTDIQHSDHNVANQVLDQHLVNVIWTSRFADDDGGIRREQRMDVFSYITRDSTFFRKHVIVGGEYHYVWVQPEIVGDNLVRPFTYYDKKHTIGRQIEYEIGIKHTNELPLIPSSKYDVVNIITFEQFPHITLEKAYKTIRIYAPQAKHIKIHGLTRVSDEMVIDAENCAGIQADELKYLRSAYWYLADHSHRCYLPNPRCRLFRGKVGYKYYKYRAEIKSFSKLHDYID